MAHDSKQRVEVLNQANFAEFISSRPYIIVHIGLYIDPLSFRSGIINHFSADLGDPDDVKALQVKQDLFGGTPWVAAQSIHATSVGAITCSRTVQTPFSFFISAWTPPPVSMAPFA